MYNGSEQQKYQRTETESLNQVCLNSWCEIVVVELVFYSTVRGAGRHHLCSGAATAACARHVPATRTTMYTTKNFRSAPLRVGAPQVIIGLLLLAESRNQRPCLF